MISSWKCPIHPDFTQSEQKAPAFLFKVFFPGLMSKIPLFNQYSANLNLKA